MADRDPRLDEVATFSNLPRHVDMDALRPCPTRRFGHLLHPATDEVFSVHHALYNDVLKAHPLPDAIQQQATMYAPASDTDRMAEMEAMLADQQRTIEQLMDLVQGGSAGDDGGVMTDIPIKPPAATISKAPPAPKGKDAGK